MSGWARAVLVGTATVAAACSTADDATIARDTTVATVATVPPAGPTDDLAPHQRTAETVAPPTLPPACDPATVSIVTPVAAADAGADGPDQVVALVNDGVVVCDVAVGAVGATVVEMEPSVRLGPGQVAHLWLVVPDDCAEPVADPGTEITLDVNGEQRPVELVAVAPCGVELVALFPA